MIMKGKDRGKTGKIDLVFPKENRVLVHGLNQVKKAVKPKKQGEHGQIVSVAHPVSANNVMLICPSCGKPTRIGYSIQDDKKQKICRKCKATI